MRQAPIRILPLLQLLLLAIFIACKILIIPPSMEQKDVPPSVPAEHMRLIALGEPQLAAQLLGFWLLSFDMQSGLPVPYERLDYNHLRDWLVTIQSLDPESEYPSMVAGGVFIEVRDPERARQMIEFVHANFRNAPAQRWRWLAQCIMLAKYRLQDPALALQLAQDLRQQTPAGMLPAWARDMEFLLLQQIGETAAARWVVNAILQSGQVHDPQEHLFLLNKLRELSLPAAPSGDE
jgi:hypothetical protein